VWGYTEPVSPARRTCIGSPPRVERGATHGLNPHALRRTAANRIDVVARLSVRTTAPVGCSLWVRPFPPRPSAGSCLLCSIASSYYDLIRLSSAYMLGVRLLPSRAGPTSPGTGETSQVSVKELHHVHEAFDCARFCPCSTTPWRCCLLASELDRHLGIRPVRSSILGPWSPL